MRRIALGVFTFLLLARPASADSGLVSQQQQVKQQLAAAATAITSLNSRIDVLQRNLDQTSRRVDRERAEVRMLARTMYTEPDSILVSVAGASSLGDALTRLTDLAVAGDRASATKRALDRDLATLSGQRASLESDLKKQVSLQHQLQQQFNRLSQMIAAESGPVGPAPQTGPPVASGPIQQIILQAFAPLGASSQTWALRVAKCESGYNPYAVNRSSGAAGLFQFMPSTWAHSPYASRNVFDPVANSEAAAWYYNQTGRTGSPWSCK